MSQLLSQAEELLLAHWNYASFRFPQKEIIESILSKQDTLAILPTGGGKSICFQVPALCQKKGMTLVVSPLIALMNDQVLQLQKRNISAAALHSGLSDQEEQSLIVQCQEGWIKLLYVSPERLRSAMFLRALEDMDIALLAVDEAHCISQWGYDFRPAYRNIHRIRELLPDVPCIALTASATPTVAQDICEQLLFTNPTIFRGSFLRPNLSFNIEKVNTPLPSFLAHLSKQNYIGSTLVYGATRAMCEQVAHLLNQQGYKATFFHAGIDSAKKSKLQSQWINNEFPIMVCTNAFGMGIDKADVRAVYHIHIPDCLENYYQEAGRAGRDGKPANAYLFCNQEDIDKIPKHIQTRYPSIDTLQQIYDKLMDYLQIRLGEGYDEEYSFDFAEWIYRFNINAQIAHYSLAHFTNQQLLSVSQTKLKKAQFQFTIRIEYLRFCMEKINNEPMYNVLQQLLRSYPNILYYPISINEEDLSEKCKMSLSDTCHCLQLLDEQEWAIYRPANRKATLTMRLNRVAKIHHEIDIDLYEKLHARAVERAKQLSKYIHSNECRNQFMASYFGDNNSVACNVCDNCSANNTRPNDILTCLEEEKTSYTIANQLHCNHQTISQHLGNLENQELVVQTKHGVYKKK